MNEPDRPLTTRRTVLKGATGLAALGFARGHRRTQIVPKLGCARERGLTLTAPTR